MGRRIPGRKHHGVRDPVKQAATRFASIKDKVNAPPSNPDDQQIPKSLQRIIDLKNKAKNGIVNKNHKKALKNTNNNQSSGSSKKSKRIQGRGIKFKQNPKESDRQFLSRVNKMCQNIVKEVAFEKKYGVQIKKNESGDITEVVKRPKDELELYLKKVRKEKKAQNKKKKQEDVKLTKAQRWQKKKKEKKLKRMLSKTSDEFEKFKDQVKFGEVAQAPPVLTSRKTQKLKNEGKKNLLLKSLFEENSREASNQILMKQTLKSIKSIDNMHNTSNETINKKGKRKDLPVALRRQLDTQQKDIITAYKLLKTKKNIME